MLSDLVEKFSLTLAKLIDDGVDVILRKNLKPWEYKLAKKHPKWPFVNKILGLEVKHYPEKQILEVWRHSKRIGHLELGVKTQGEFKLVVAGTYQQYLHFVHTYDEDLQNSRYIKGPEDCLGFSRSATLVVLYGQYHMNPAFDFVVNNFKRILQA